MTFFGPFLATIFWTAGFKYLPAGRAAIYNQLSTTFIIILATVILISGVSPLIATKVIKVPNNRH